MMIKLFGMGAQWPRTISLRMQRQREKHPDWKNKVVLIGASVDEDSETVVKHLKKKGWDKTHNVLAGPEALKAFHVGGIPTVFVIDQLGRIAAHNGAGELDIPEIVNDLISFKAGDVGKSR